MISYLHKFRRDLRGKSFAAYLVLAYAIFALAPFLLLHSHSDLDQEGFQAETTHAHVWNFWGPHFDHSDPDQSHPDHADSDRFDPEEGSEHDKGLGSDEHPSSHSDDLTEGHEGLDDPHFALASSNPGMAHFHAPNLRFLEPVDQIPKSALQGNPDQVPISADFHFNGLSSFLLCDLPPPSFA